MLPPEILCLVWEQLPASWNALRLRSLCNCWQARPLPLVASDKVISYAVNKATLDGQLSAVKWLLAFFEVTLPTHQFCEYPAAFAIERGHVDILEYLYPQHLNPHDLNHFSGSYEICINNRHFHVVDWVIQFLQEAGHSACYRIGWLKEKVKDARAKEKRLYKNRLSCSITATFDNCSFYQCDWNK